jgi:hypothetical protein
LVTKVDNGGETYQPPPDGEPTTIGDTITGMAGPDGSIITALARPSSSASHPSLILNVTLVTAVHHTVLDPILTATTGPISVYILLPLANFLHNQADVS